jgi:hypothetical protein
LKTYNLVFFHTEGPPNDKGHNLTECRDIILNGAKPYMDNISYYNPRILKEMGFEYFVKEYDDLGCCTNPNFHKMGFAAWKSLIIKLELEKLNEGDILLYRDSNTFHYPPYADYSDVKEVVDFSLNHCNFDFFISRETDDTKLKHHCKTNIIRELGEDHPFTYEFPLLASGFIAMKKSKISVELVDEWVKGSENKEWSTGKVYGDLHPTFEWSTPEQAILGVIIANWIRKRKYNIPINYPNLIMGLHKNEVILNRIPENYEYLKLLEN